MLPVFWAKYLELFTEKHFYDKKKNKQKTFFAPPSIKLIETVREKKKRATRLFMSKTSTKWADLAKKQAKTKRSNKVIPSGAPNRFYTPAYTKLYASKNKLKKQKGNRFNWFYDRPIFFYHMTTVNSPQKLTANYTWIS